MIIAKTFSFNYPKSLILSAALVLLAITSPLQLTAQTGSGLGFVADFNFYFTPSVAVITNTTTNEKITVSTQSKSYRPGVGIYFAKFNMLYAFIDIRNGSTHSISNTKFITPATADVNKLIRFNHDIDSLGVGIGYRGFIGEQKRNGLNFFGGLELSSINYTNKYRGSTIFQDVKSSNSFTPIFVYAGINFLPGSADLHLIMGYEVATESKAKKLSGLGVSVTDTYTETVDLSGLAFGFGVTQYF